jgi:hypothetical protein
MADQGPKPFIILLQSYTERQVVFEGVTDAGAYFHDQLTARGPVGAA